MAYRTIDLFAGIGGIRMGFEQAGFKTVFSNDFEPRCKPVFDANHGLPNLTVGDIRRIATFQIPQFDVLTGGFPCQAFSVAGEQKGFTDERGNLFFEIERILRERSPKPVALFLENVKNLKSHDGGRTYKRIYSILDGLGYKITEEILNSSDYGVPQNRERIYIVGFLSEKAREAFCFPDKIRRTRSVEDLLDKEVDPKYYYEGKGYEFTERDGSKKPLYDKLKVAITKPFIPYQYRRYYVRQNKNAVCPTLTANMGSGGHNVPLVLDRKGVRKLTPRECLRFQGFPDSFAIPEGSRDSHIYKQAGNSVTVPVIAAIAKRMMTALATAGAK